MSIGDVQIENEEELSGVETLASYAYVVIVA